MTQLFTKRTFLFLVVLLLCSLNMPGQGRSGQRARIRNPNYYDKELTNAQKQLLNPSAQDQALFSNFLSQPDTGIFRLLPAGKYAFTSTVSANVDPETVLPIRGGGAFYSFTKRSHKYGPWSEISLQDEKLVVGFDSGILGLMTSLGDVPLESVTDDTAAVSFLAEINPPNRFFDIQEQRSKYQNGVVSKGLVYKKAFPSVPNTTYVMRSTNYRREGFLDAVYKIYIPHPSDYQGSDSLIALRVVRQDQDGSAIIVWKRLKRFKAPKLKEPGLDDFKAFIEREVPLGSDSTRILDFLNSNKISNTGLSDEKDDSGEHANRKASSVIRASILNIERSSFAVFDLSILFLLDEEGKLIEHRLAKVQRSIRRFR
jgi:hypothetical protein